MLHPSKNRPGRLNFLIDARNFLIYNMIMCYLKDNKMQTVAL